ncbi:MAG: restriction endonuclease subunit S [Sideroxydans sp.]|nr:restriction endonuclease subunit S [Sideroxydans sp.]
MRGKDMLVERNKRSTHGAEELLSVSTYTGVKPRREMLDSEDALSRADSLVDYKKCFPGDIVINTMLAWNGSIGLSNYTGIVSPAYAVYQLRKGFEARFVEYLLRSDATLIKIRAESRGINDARLRLYPDSLFAIQFGAPPLPEQLAIADYLDRQTAQIDQRLATLAEKKTVLAELRKATIHEVVTKGLKATSMDHWTTVRIKDVAKLNPPTLLPKLDEVDFFPMEAIGVDGGLTLGQRKEVTQAGGYSQMKNGDVCFAKVTPCFENGKSAIVEGLDTKVALATTEITVLRPNKKISRHFLHYRIKGLDFASGGANEMKGAGGLKRVPERFAADFVFQLPPLSEQLAIADHLDQQTQQFDAQLATLDEQARVLKELRKAIIHEAVTGKIDLSNYTPQTPEELAA